MSKRRIRDLAALIVLIVSAAGASVLATRIVPVLAAAENWLVDLRVSLLSTARPQHPEIVLVVVNEDTLAGLTYRSPVDRGFLSNVLQWLDAAGAKAIGVDILFDQATEPAKDARLRETILALHAPTVVAWADRADGLTEGQSAWLEQFSEGMRPGSVTLMTDSYDAVVRWIYPGRNRDGGAYIESFPIALSALLGGEAPREVWKLGYRPGPDRATPAFRSFPAHLLPLLPRAWFKDRIVLIGSDLPHSDRHRTPLSVEAAADASKRPGVEVHAHAVAQLLAGEPAPEIGRWVTVVTVAVVAAAALLVGSLQISTAAQLGIGVTCFTALWLAGFGLYYGWNVLIPLVSPSLAFALSVAFGNAHWHAHTRRQAAFVRNAFSRFTSPAVVRELIRDPERLRLGGEKREISCVFTDLAGFTSWLESSDPGEAIGVLNNYLEGMCRITFEHDGTIDKIVGDALHVLFNAPLDQPDHAARAVACALAMDRFACAFAEEQRAAGHEFGLTRIGVHTGMAVVGNFGGDRFFDYTAYGDMVNTCARLESANKYLGTCVCVSAETASKTPGTKFRPIGSVLLSGKSQPLDLLEPLDDRSPQVEYLDEYLEAFRSLRENGPCSGEKMTNIWRTRPHDGLAGLHARRLQEGAEGVVIRLTEK